MSTEDLIRELEAGGVLDTKSPAPLVKAQKRTSRPVSGPDEGTPRDGRTSGLVFFLVSAVLVAVVGSLPFLSLGLYPFALFVTLLHECGHGLATFISGGSVSNLRINSDLSGVVYSRGGIQALIAPAGYLGATLAGVGMLLAPLRYAKWILGSLAAIPLLALIFFQPATTFTWIWCGVFAVSLGLAAWRLSPRLAAFLQIFLGIEAGLNAFRDVTNLMFASGDSHIQTDATNMSHALFGPPAFWAVLWSFLSIALLVGACLALVRRDAPGLQFRGRRRKQKAS